MTKRHCSLVAPISGQIVSLEGVPDPVFAEKMTGDGLAITAESEEVLAPCDGVISLFFDFKHAFAITTPEGIQILVHIGLDTVVMEGMGITALCKSGERVKAGTPVLHLDIDLLRRRKINLISPLLIVNYDKVEDMRLPKKKRVKAGDTVLEYAV